MKNLKIAARRFAALAMTTLIILIYASAGYAEFYRYNIDELARKAKARIREIEQKMAEEELRKELDKISADITSLYEKAESLLAERRYEEAVTVYRKIDRMSRDGEILRTLKKADEAGGAL